MQRTRIRSRWPLAPRLSRAGVVVGVVVLTLGSALLPRGIHGMPAPGDTGPTDPAVTDNTGAARFRIPIAVPPGPGGFAPRLALSYSSRSGDGPFGVGWRLGIPEIRCSGRFGVPDLAACEDYELGDTLLVENPSEPGRYHTFVESFRRIRHYPGQDRWTVEQPDGTTLYFGTTADHRVTQNGETARWLLERMEDAFGNPIHFEYDTSTDTGSAYPASITYGAGASAGNGPRQVTFVYEPRPDPRLLFTSGVERHITRRLREVRVFGHGQIFRRYRVGYDLAGVTYSTSRSRLSWVEEFGTDCTNLGTDPVGNCPGLPRRTFRYRDAQDAGSRWEDDDDYRIRFGSYPMPYSRNYNHFVPFRIPQLIGDLNGDGLPDRLEIQLPEYNGIGENSPYLAATVRIKINTGSGFHGSDDTGPHAQIASQFEQSFQGLTYDRLRLEYEQIPVPDSMPETYWSQLDDTQYGLPFGPSYFAMCSVLQTTSSRSLADGIRSRGLSAATTPAGSLEAAAVGSPVSGSYEPLPSLRMVDLDADGLAELVVSTRLGSVSPRAQRASWPIAHCSCRSGRNGSRPSIFSLEGDSHASKLRSPRIGRDYRASRTSFVEGCDAFSNKLASDDPGNAGLVPSRTERHRRLIRRRCFG